MAQQSDGAPSANTQDAGADDEALRSAAGVPPRGVESDSTADKSVVTPATVASGKETLGGEEQQGATFADVQSGAKRVTRDPDASASADVSANVDGLGDLDGSELRRETHDDATEDTNTARRDGGASDTPEPTSRA